MHPSYLVLGAALLATAGPAASQNSIRTLDLSPLHQDTVFATAQLGTDDATFAAFRQGSGSTTSPMVVAPELGLAASYNAIEFDTANGNPVLNSLQSDRRGHGLFFNRVHSNGARDRALAFKVSAETLDPQWYFEYAGPDDLGVRFEEVVRVDSPSDPGFIALATIDDELTAVLRIGADGAVQWARRYDFASEQLAVIDLVLRDNETAAIVCAEKDPSLANPATVLQMITLHNGNTFGRPRRLPEFGTFAGVGPAAVDGMAFAPSFGVSGSTGDLYVAKNSSITGEIVIAGIAQSGNPGTTVRLTQTQGWSPKHMAFDGAGKLLMAVTDANDHEYFIHLNEVDLPTGGTFAVVRNATNSAGYTGVNLSDLVQTVGSPIGVARAQTTTPAGAGVWLDDFAIATSSCLPFESWQPVRARTRLSWVILPRVDSAQVSETPQPRLIAAAPAAVPVDIFSD